MKLVLVVFLVCNLAHVAIAAPKIDPSLYRSLVLKKSTNILVSFHGSRTNIIRNDFRMQSRNLSTREEKLNRLYVSLKDHADETQVNVLTFLRSQRTVNHRQLWVSNQIVISNADLQTVQKLMNFSEISEIKEDSTVATMEPTEVIETPEGFIPKEGEQWGVVEVGAPEVWASGNRGEGVVVGVMGSGLNVNHEALRDRVRSEYSWFCAVQNVPCENPFDNDGWGTSTAGVILGSANGVGVAPGATVIACLACYWQSCSRSALLECGQWMACPTDPRGNNPNCSLAPHIVSNSWWGNYGLDTYYDEILDTWNAVGIVPIFNVGDRGPLCSTADLPADSTKVIAVGAVDHLRQIRSTSSLGPTTATGSIKPDVVAPGSLIVYPAGGNTYNLGAGTRFAAAHVAGVAALLLSAEPSLNFEEVWHIITSTAQPSISEGRYCGGIADSVYPNNHAGYGIVNAAAAVGYLKNSTRIV